MLLILHRSTETCAIHYTANEQWSPIHSTGFLGRLPGVHYLEPETDVFLVKGALVRGVHPERQGVVVATHRYG